MKQLTFINIRIQFVFKSDGEFVRNMSKREAIVSALHAGKAIPDIMSELGVSRANIFNTKKALKD